MLRKLRLDCGLTQQQLADRAGLRQAHISAIEAGRDVKLSTINKIMNAVGAEIMVTEKHSDAVLQTLSKIDAKLQLILEELDNK